VTAAEAVGLRLDQRRAERVPVPGVGQAQQEPRVAARERARRVVWVQVPPLDVEPPLLLLQARALARVAAAQAPGRAAEAPQEHERARAHRSPTRRQC
jgi:hypothetical protein